MLPGASAGGVGFRSWVPAKRANRTTRAAGDLRGMHATDVRVDMESYQGAVVGFPKLAA